MKKLAIIIILFVLTGTAISACTSTGNVTKESKYDNFAKCLTENGTKMYGAYWCSHCKNQKEMFGDSFKHINYIECSLPDGKGQTQECNQAGIRRYPTWEFKDSKRVERELPFEQLSQYSGCEIPQ
ncbi:hypothetical protein J4230_00745 [Candidatus Woesearchaeota archaeon]|nr:hypothetical protein [Candidatus Woesearchaeota archaeon]